MTPTALVIATDVTRSKKTEESLRESEERFDSWPRMCAKSFG